MIEILQCTYVSWSDYVFSFVMRTYCSQLAESEVIGLFHDAMETSGGLMMFSMSRRRRTAIFHGRIHIASANVCAGFVVTVPLSKWLS